MLLFFNLIKIFVAIMFIYYGIHKLTFGHTAKAKFFNAIKFRPGWLFALMFGVLELLVGLGILFTVFIVPALIIVIAIMSICLYIKYRTPHLLGGTLPLYAALLLGAIILLVIH